MTRDFCMLILSGDYLGEFPGIVKSPPVRFKFEIQLHMRTHVLNQRVFLFSIFYDFDCDCDNFYAK